MSKSTADRQMIQLAIVFVCLISSSFEAKTKSRAQPRSQESSADWAQCAASNAVNEIGLCVAGKWPEYARPNKDRCCYEMNNVCAQTDYMREKCTLKSDFEQKVKDRRNEAMVWCDQVKVTWSESLCDSWKDIPDPNCQQYETFLDCKDVNNSSTNANPTKDTEKSSGLSLRYPAVTELLLVALLIKYFI